jgi:hypothetical protein
MAQEEQQKSTNTDRKIKSTKVGLTVKKLLVAIVLIAALVVIGFLGWVYIYQKPRDTAALASTAPIREMILLGADSTKTNAPVDPKTGDIYFPQARLYIPNDSATNLLAQSNQLTYAYDPNTPSAENEEVLSISNRVVFNQIAAKMYGAKNFEELFKIVPKLQSCQRGIALSYSAKNDESYLSVYELKEKVKLNTGGTMYIYLDKGCPELSATVELLKNIRQY